MRTEFRPPDPLVLLLIAALLMPGMAAADGMTLTPAAPAEAGMSEDALQSALVLYRDAVKRQQVVGAVLLVARNGRVVLHEALGWRDRERGQPMRKDSMFRMGSNTKPVVATGIAILEERDRLHYTDPVRRYLPGFDNYRAGFIQVQHLLTHTSGLRIGTLFLEPLSEPSAQHPDAPNLVAEAERFGAVGADVLPGTSYSYSNPGYNTLGALIELRAGQKIDTFLREAVYDPLGMRDSYHLEVAGRLDGKLSRMGVVYYDKSDGEWQPGWTPGDPPVSPFPRASGGMISTAMDYAAFCQMFLNGGSYGGRRILQPETVARMTRSQTAALGVTSNDYGYGWAIDGDRFGHGGSDGTYAWVDRGRGIVGIILTQTPAGNRMLVEPFKELVTRAAL